ncbi:MAG: L-fuculokinase [Candidatus Neomarinimicrobiota bacterium]
MNYLGIDIGTSGCKAVMFDKDGQQLTRANREYSVIFSDNGGAELDSDEVMEKCFEVIKECAAQVESGSVRGMGISSQGEAFTPISADGKALCNAMIHSDTRPRSYVKIWPQEFGEKKLYQITGHTAHSVFSVFKLFWLKDNRPEVWAKAQKFLCFEDLLQLRLGLDPTMGWPLAARTMMFDVRKHAWNRDILNAVGLSLKQLAKPLPSGSIVGKIDNRIAKDLGLSGDTFVVTGGHDQPCSALGAGVTKPGTAIYATGTVECITAASAKPAFTEELRQSNLCTYDHAVKGMYASLAYSLTGGNILKWFRDEFGAWEVAEAEQTGVNAYELLLDSMGEQPSSLLVLPYFTPSGTPYFDSKTKGAVLGLQISTTRGEFIRALLEGVAFEMRLNLEILEKSGYEINELRATGGGAKSAVWNQLKANVMGKKITTLNVTETGCLGVAMLACAADTGKSIRELASKWVRPLSTVHPQPEHKKWYDERFKLYRTLYHIVREIPL